MSAKKVHRGPARHPLTKRVKTRRRAPEEKTALLSRYDALRAEGVLTVDICAQLNVSSATLYRWLRQRPLTVLQSGREIRDIDVAIDVLCNPGNFGKYEILHSIFYFAAWLRWPSDPSLIRLAVSSCAAAYILAKSSAIVCISKLDEKEAGQIAQHIALEDIAHIYKMREKNQIPHWYTPNDRNDPRFLIGDIVCIIMLDGNSIKSRLSGSLNKAYDKIQNFNGYSGRSVSSRHTFNSIWNENASAAPFQYIETYHSQTTWRFKPSEERFVLEVDYLLDETEEVRMFFEKCLWACDELKKILNKRVLGRMDLPVFPHGLTPCSCPIEKPSNGRKPRPIAYRLNIKH